MTKTKDEPGPKRLHRLKQKIKSIKKRDISISELSLINLDKLKKFVLSFWGYAKNNKKIVGNIAILTIIAISPWVSEVSMNRQVYAQILEYSQPLDPVRAGELSESIGKFTPVIEENKDDVAIAQMTKNPSYSLAQQLSINEGKQIDEPERQAATYEVQKGETITQIAQKFDLHVATILDANDIDPVASQNIKPGTVLDIPSSDTSTSQDWLVAINNAKEEERQRQAEEARKRQLALASSRAYAASSTTRQTGASYSAVDTGSLIVPISYRSISRGFGYGHTGIDYAASTGTPIRAAGSGSIVVTSYGWSGGYGNQIVVDHGGGRATRYAHLSSISVSPGQTVSQGQVIGYSGNSGRSTGPHLHFEVIINGRPVPWP